VNSNFFLRTQQQTQSKPNDLGYVRTFALPTVLMLFYAVVVPHLVRIYRERRVLDWNTYAMVATIELARDSKKNPGQQLHLTLTYGAPLLTRQARPNLRPGDNSNPIRFQYRLCRCTEMNVGDRHYVEGYVFACPPTPLQGGAPKANPTGACSRAVPSDQTQKWLTLAHCAAKRSALRFNYRQSPD